MASPLSSDPFIEGENDGPPDYRRVTSEQAAALSMEAERFPALHSIERKTGFKKRYIALALISFLTSVVFFGAGVRIFADFIAVLYPVFQTFKTIKKPTNQGINEMLTYWVVWGVFSTTERLSDRLFSWFPIYYFLKFIFLAWCLVPGSQGSKIVYNYLLMPIFREHHQRIDTFMKDTHSNAARTMDKMFFRALSKDFGTFKLKTKRKQKPKKGVDSRTL